MAQDPKHTEDEEELKDLPVNEGVDDEDMEKIEEEDAEEEKATPISSRLEDEEEVIPGHAAAEDNSEEDTEREVEEDDSEESESPKTEHDLDDLAQEEEVLPTGVEPHRPKSFNMDEEPPRRSFNSSFPSSGVYTSKPGRSKKGSLGLLLVIALLVIGGSVFLLKSRLGKGSTTPSPSETTTTVVTPSETPAPSFDRSKYKIRVLNGTSTAGLAASVSAKLKSLGYQTDKTGNASNSAFTKTMINSKSSISGLVESLIKDLSPDFSAQKGGTLPDSDASDAEVILGTH